jgi:hypothetical protein
MGWDHHSLAKLPPLYTIVGCAWPLDENPEEPGPKVRPCLVVQRAEKIGPDGVRYGTLTVAYGSKEGTREQWARDFSLGQSEYRTYGLRHPTRFSVDLIEEFIWGPKWFPPHPFIVNRGVKVGDPLKQEQIARWSGCRAKYKADRGLP